jgi:hypothetical protein
VTAPLTLINILGCNAEDYRGLNGAGRIAFIMRGNCTFVTKLNFAKSYNYSAVIIVNNLPGRPPTTRIGANFETNLPTLFLSQEIGTPVVDKLNVTTPPEIVVTFSIVVDNRYQISSSVVATSTWGNPDKALIIGAHLDSVPEGPGLNDDGVRDLAFCHPFFVRPNISQSGSSTVAELAVQLSKFGGIKNQVRFAWWTVRYSQESRILDTHLCRPKSLDLSDQDIMLAISQKKREQKFSGISILI